MIGPLQKLYNAGQIANDEVLTPEMEAKGTYASSIHPSQGKRFVNNHDPVERWKAAGKLTQSQQVVIEMCQRLWRLAGLQQRLTASYGERMPASAGYELRALTEIEAREDLHRIQGYFPGELKAYWNVFENCCRHGMPAGIAGGEDDRNGAHRAFMIVGFVASMIATYERV